MDRRALIGAAVLAFGCGPTDTRTCIAPEGMGSPRDVDETLALLQALPEGADPACFVESLDRPLTVVATSSVVSAQPASGVSRPRLFLMGDTMTLSVVPEGDGAHLLEFGLWLDPTTSLKAEFALPLAEGITVQDAFDRVQFDETRTGCGFCHLNEVVHETVDGVPRYASDALRPLPDTLVALEEVQAARDACADDDTTCALLRALLDHGAVQQGAFDRSVPVVR